MTTQAAGFWQSGVAGRREANQDNFNAQLLQFGNTTELEALVDKLGMLGFDTLLRRFVRNNGTDQVALEMIEIGVDSNKPASGVANNGRIYLATDTGKLYGVIGGILYTLAIGSLAGTTQVTNDLPADIIIRDPAIPGISPDAPRRDHGHRVRSDTPVSIGTQNLEGDSLRLGRANHQHDHPTGFHERGGARQLDGDKIHIDYNPSSYTRKDTPAEVDHVTELTAHLKGIDDGLGSMSGDMGSAVGDAIPSTIIPDTQSVPGTSDSSSRENHGHGVTTGQPSEIGTNNSEGTSQQFVRRDHGHDHPTGMHERSGGREIDGDKLDIDFNPSNYTPSSTPVEVDHVDDLSAHLKGMDDRVAQATATHRGTIEMADGTETNGDSSERAVSPNGLVASRYTKVYNGDSAPTVDQIAAMAEDDLWVEY